MNDANETRDPLAVTTARYSVPLENLSVLENKIAKLSRKAVKLNLPAIELKKVGEKDVPFKRSTGGVKPSYSILNTPELLAAAQKSIASLVGGIWERTVTIVYRKYVDIELTGAVPRLAGWEFVATLQHMEVDGETVNMLRIVPGFEGVLPVRFRTATPDHCDHCQTVRARKDTFVVRNPVTAEWKQVGRNCTQDFLGGRDPHDVAKYLEYLQQAADACGSDFEGMGGGYVDCAAMEEFLGWVAACIRIDGWVSRGKARLMDGQVEATADSAFNFACPPDIRDPQAAAKFAEARRLHTPTDEDKATASKALAYAADDLEGKTAGNDYLYNLWVACNQLTVNHRLAGIAASLISHFLKEVERQVIRELELKRVGDSKFVGAVGERRFFQVTVLKVIVVGLDSMYGPSSLHRMVDGDGNLIIWFASGEGDNLKPGTTYWLKATVKKHEERAMSKEPGAKVVKQTVVTRADVFTEEEAKVAIEKDAKKAARKAAKIAKAVDSAAVVS